MPESHSGQTWVKLYELVATSIASKVSLLDESWRNEEPILTFLKRIERPGHQRQHIPSMWHTRQRFYDDGKLLEVHRELPPGGTEPSNATSDDNIMSPRRKVKRVLSRLTSMWIVRGKACIGVTREELAALAIVMGVTFPRRDQSLYLSGVGGFGLSLDISHADTSWSISVVQGSRLPRHAASMGDGYTTLMAKHLACGSVPFAQNNSWILSVYVTPNVYNTLKTGGKIVDKRAFGGDSLEFLRRLPGDKLIDAFYGTAVATPGSSVGLIFHADGKTEAGKWPRAVAGIAFGGLVPQASPNVVAAVKFTVAGVNLEGCIENLENLIDLLHRKAVLKPAEEENLFGENVLQRYHVDGHSFVNYTFPSEHSNPPDAAAIFARYSNLLGRVVALAIDHTKDPGSATSVDENDVFEAAISGIQKVYESAVAMELNQTFIDTELANKDLGAVLEKLIGKLDDPKNHHKIFMGQPAIELSDCADIVRCVLAAWAFTVPLIEVKQAAGTGSLSDNSRAPDGNKVPNEIVLASLPPVSALC